MQRKTLLNVLFALIIMILSANLWSDPVFTQGFEDAWTGTPLAPAGWTNYSTTASVSWQRSTTYFASGAASARVGYTAGNHWLVSPAIAVPTGNHRLKIMARDHSASTSWDYADEYLKIFVSTQFSGTVDVFTTEILSLGYLDLNTAFAVYTADLSAYAGQTVYIAMERIATGGNYVYVDDFTVEPILPVPPNPATYGLPIDNSPVINNPLIKWTASTTGEPQTGFKLYLDTTNNFTNPVYTGTATSFQTAGLLNATTYYWKVVPFNTYGDATVTEVRQFTTAGAAQLAESFEGASFPPAGWDRDGTTWVSSTSLAFDGTKSTSVSTAATGSAAAAKKLITPKVTVGAGSYLRFMAATTSTGVQSIQIKTSPDKITWTDFGTPYNLTPNVWNIFNVDLSTLTPGNYYIAIGGYSAGNSGTIYADYVIGPDITPEIPGPALTPVPADLALNVSNMPTLGWSAPTTGGVPTGYHLYFGTASDNLTLLQDVTTNSYVFTTALPYNAVRYWKVVPFNAAGSAADCPVWSFTVMADPTVIPPYTQDFATFPPLNWERKAGLLNANSTLTGTSSSWVASTNFGNVTGAPSGAATKLNIYGTSKKDWLITPPVNVTSTEPLQLEFDLALTAYNATTAPALTGVDDKFAVVVSLDNGVTWSDANILKLWDNVETTPGAVYNEISLTGQRIILPLTGLTGIVRFGFYGESTVSNADNDLHVDNVVIHTVPTVPIFAITPAEKNFGTLVINTSASQLFTISNTGNGNLLINSITIAGDNAFTVNHSLTFPVTLAPQATAAFTVNYLPTTVGPKTATVTINDNMTRIAHTVALSGDCVNPNITTLPHTQNFDAAVVPALPIGWTVYASNTGTNARPWVTQAQTATNPGAVSQPNFVGSFYHSTLPKNEWMVSPAVSLTAGTTYRLRFMVKAPGWQGTPEKMEVKVANQVTLEAITAGTQIWNDANMLIPNYTEKVVAYTPATTGNYYFGFHSYSDADIDYIAIDDVTFEVGPVFNAPTNLTAQAGNATVALTWNAPAAGSTGTLAGYTVYRNNTALNTTPITATNYTDNTVTNGTTYAYFVKAIFTNPNGESDPSNTVNATPFQPVLYPPANLTAAVNDNDVTLNWEVGGPELETITHSTEYTANVGTNSAAQFSCAQRFTQEQLVSAGASGGMLYKVGFVGHIAEATYTVKVWTGGSAAPYAPGTLVASKTVTGPITVDEETVVTLDNPVLIPETGELWFGYDVNTPSGNPAGADAGPALDGFGNIMYFNNSWTTLLTLASTLNRNWCITGQFAPAVDMGPLAEKAMPNQLRSLSVKAITPQRQEMSLNTVPSIINCQPAQRTSVRTLDRNLIGFKVYRGTTLLTSTPLPATTLTYADNDVAYGQYTYKVTSVYSEGESEPTEINVNVVEQGNSIINDNFDAYTDFALEFGQWVLVDGDQSETYGITNVDFPGSGGPMAYIIFNPSTTTPPVTSITPHSGAKMAACFAATAPPNNDWMITPAIHLTAGATPKIKFWVKSHTAQYGLERFVVCVGPTSNPAQMTPISTGAYVEAPIDWTEFEYSLSSYVGQTIHVGIHCVSNDAFVFYVDDFRVYGNGNIVANQDPIVVPESTRLMSNYPNPFNPSTSIKYALKEKAHVTIEVYNVKGQKVRSLVNGMMDAGYKEAVWNGKDDNNQNVGSGVYFYKMKSGKYTATGKMILMK